MSNKTIRVHRVEMSDETRAKLVTGVDRLPGPLDTQEAVDAAQQLFEASVAKFTGTLTQKAVYVTGILDRWPWLRPNRYMKR